MAGLSSLSFKAIRATMMHSLTSTVRKHVLLGSTRQMAKGLQNIQGTWSQSGAGTVVPRQDTFVGDCCPALSMVWSQQGGGAVHQLDSTMMDFGLVIAGYVIYVYSFALTLI